MTPEERARRFTYHPPHGDQPTRYDALRTEAGLFAETINSLCPESREQSLAFTHLEQAVMWANAAIARRDPSPGSAPQSPATRET